MNRSARVRAARVLAVLGLALAASGWAAAPGYASVTLGYRALGSASFFVGCGEACTLVPIAMSEEGALVQSPVNGAIVRWRIAGAENLGPLPEFALQVVKRGSGLSFTATGNSASVTPAGSGVETFSTNLPIEVGDYIGIKLSGEGEMGGHNGGKLAFLPPLGEGASSGLEFPYEEEFNADVQPQPTILLLNPSSGPPAGGTVVTVAGTDFTGVTAVKFGNVPASSFTVESEHKLTAVSPAASPGVVDLSVTTNAGTSAATGADHFEYTASATALTCVVPKLKGKTLKAAKKRARKAHCRIGSVKLLAGVTKKTGKVVKQKPKAGKVKAAGRKIAVTLG
jgi:IPT/TIG domain/PASTA domain